jgi:hypothetical protein
MIRSEGDLGDYGLMNADVFKDRLEIIGGLVLVIRNGVLVDVDGCVVFDGGGHGGGELPHTIT